VHFCHPRDRRHHRDGGLAAAGHHIDVAFGQIGLEIDHRHAVRADGRRGQVDHPDPRPGFPQRGVVFHVRSGAGGVKNHIDIGEFRHLHQAANALVRGGDAHAPGAGQAVGLGVDADHYRHLQVLPVAQNFDH